jgi:hypothetical protein
MPRARASPVSVIILLRVCSVSLPRFLFSNGDQGRKRELYTFAYLTMWVIIWSS